MGKKVLVFIGPPGSGKGTQASVFSKQLGLPHISTGDIFRSIIENKLDDYKQIESYILKGELVPAELVNSMVIKYINSNECRAGCILDGYPRDVEQAQFFCDNINSDVEAIYFNVSEEVIKKRISGRITCTKCGHIYNMHFDNIHEKDACKKCNSFSLSARSDDNENTIIKRLEEYKQNTLPVIDIMEDNFVLHRVNADKEKHSISETISILLKKD